MKNGTTYNTDFSQSSEQDYLFLSGSDSTSLFKSYNSFNFSRIIDIDEVESVTIGNEVIQIQN